MIPALSRGCILHHTRMTVMLVLSFIWRVPIAWHMSVLVLLPLLCPAIVLH